MICTCGGGLQATRKTYFDVSESGHLVRSALTESWEVYCENDDTIISDSETRPTVGDIHEALERMEKEHGHAVID